MATAKQKFQGLVFNLAKEKVFDFLDELQKLAKDAFGVAAQAIAEQFVYDQMLRKLKKSINQAHLENGTCDQIVSHLVKKLQLDGSEATDDLQKITVKQQVTQQNPDRRKPKCHNWKNPSHHRNQCRQNKRERNHAQNEKKQCWKHQ